MSKQLFTSYKFWLTITAIALFAGNIIGWGTTFIEVKDYCDQLGFGALTDFSGDLIDNPLLTPCFWGSVAFLIAFIWNVILLRKIDSVKVQKSFRWFVALLIAGTLFALVNNIPIFVGFYENPDAAVSCSNNKISSPFLTSCFFGFSAYATALLAGSFALFTFTKTQ